MRKAETNYWKEEFQKATNSKDFWRTVKKVQKNRANNKIGPIQDDSGTVETRDKVKAELMNYFFATIGEKLANELPDNQHTEEENYTTCPSEITTAPILFRHQLRHKVPTCDCSRMLRFSALIILWFALEKTVTFRAYPARIEENSRNQNHFLQEDVICCLEEP